MSGPYKPKAVPKVIPGRPNAIRDDAVVTSMPASRSPTSPDSSGVNDEATEQRPSLTMRSPDDLLTMEFDDGDMILGDRILAEGQALTILGQGGIGKSRLLLQLACCQITSRPFLRLPTYGPPRRWAIFQGENSNRRLHDDLADLRLWIGEDDWPLVNANLLIHTLETDEDNELCLEQSQARIQKAIEEFAADVVCFDPLSNFSLADLNSDAEMRALCVNLTRTVKAGNHKRALVVLHHSIAGRAGAQKATGYDRSAFGRNSKALLAWTRAQVNVAPGSADDTDVLVMACGKNNNGMEFQTFACRRNVGGIYEEHPAFDFATWGKEMAGKAGGKSATVADVLAALEDGALSKRDLVATLQADGACGKSLAYKLIDAAERQKVIYLDMSTKLFTRV